MNLTTNYHPFTAMSKIVEVKKIFKEHGLTPKKWMGQNLLVDRHYLERIVASAAVEPGTPIVEIGAGLGVLTKALVERGADVWALEVDSGFAQVLLERFVDDPKIRIIHADALKYDFRRLAQGIGNLRVVANLPYNISSRLIFRFFEHRNIFSSLCILLQREVAERLIAQPNTKDYGILTVLLAMSARVEILFDIPPRAFYPVPAVTSSLVRISFPDNPPLQVSDDLLLTRLVKASFAGRRKTLRNTLLKAKIPGVSSGTLEQATAEAGIDVQRRAETLLPEEYCRLAETVANASARE